MREVSERKQQFGIRQITGTADILGNMFSMSTLGLSEHEAEALGPDDATRIRTFRLIVLLAQQLRTLMDQALRAEGLTTQQAALLTIVDAIGRPSLSEVAAAFGTTHQNAKQIAVALERKGLLRIVVDDEDRRVRRLVTTEKNRAVWLRRSATDQQRVLEWFSGLAEDEARTLFELLLRLEGGVQTALDR
jgi:DNA-binding MarR family transcriptional regulator